MLVHHRVNIPPALISSVPKTLQVALDMLHAATFLATLQKVEDSSTFLATWNATFCCIASCENGVSHGKLFLQLAMQRVLRCKLEGKLSRVT